MKNRRFGSNAMMKIFSGISFIAWIVLGAKLLILEMEKPAFYGFAASLQKIKGANPETISLIHGILIFIIVLSVLGILINLFRMKRRSDRLKFSIILSGVLAAAVLILIQMK